MKSRRTAANRNAQSHVLWCDHSLLSPDLCQYEAGTRTSREFGHHDMGILKGNKCSRGVCAEYKTHEGTVGGSERRLSGKGEVTVWSHDIS